MISRRQFLSRACGFGLTSMLLPAQKLVAEDSGVWFERMRPLMGTYVSVAVFHHSRQNAEILIDSAFEYMQRLIKKISTWDTASDAQRLAETRMLHRENCTEDFLSLATLAENVRKISHGAYNPLCQKLCNLWREAKAGSTFPHRADIREHVEMIARSRFELSTQARLHGKESFDFGGIGKGYVADRCCAFLRENGVRFARVAASGDLSFLGDTEWSVDVEHPRSENDTLQTLVLRGSGGIATSGDYRNFWFVHGERYHHLIDPRSGTPGRYCSQVTAVHRSAAFADGLATAAFFMAPLDGISFLRNNAASGVIVDSRGKIYRVNSR